MLYLSISICCTSTCTIYTHIYIYCIREYVIWIYMIYYDLYIPLCSQSSIWISFFSLSPSTSCLLDHAVQAAGESCAGQRDFADGQVERHPQQKPRHCSRWWIVWRGWLKVWWLKSSEVHELLDCLSEISKVFFFRLLCALNLPVFCKISQISATSQPSNLPNQLSIYHQGLVIRLGW